MNAESIYISVCMATYNGEKFIKSQIDSIILQLSDSDELIISDNGSSDGTMGLLHSYSDTRIKIFSCDQNGLVSNFENALKNAKGQYIFLSDQDDMWMPGKLRLMLRELKTADLVMSNAIVTDATLAPLSPTLKIFDFSAPSKSLIRNIYKNSFTGCCIAFNRAILKAVLPFPENLPMHDWWIGLVSTAIGSISFINESTLLYRRHSNNASTLSIVSKNSIIKCIIMRLILI